MLFRSLKRVAALEFDRFLKYYENASDLNVSGSQGQSRAEGKGGREGRDRRQQGSGGYQRLFVNLGTKDGFYKADIEISQEKFDELRAHCDEWIKIQEYLKQLMEKQNAE